jgi:hypothetical protein
VNERVQVTVEFPGLPVTEPLMQTQFESPGFAPTPNSVETLRHIADTISGDGAFIMQGILRRAADELEAETARLDFLIGQEAYVWNPWHQDTWKVAQAAEDGAELTPGKARFETAREAIDAARDGRVS